MKIELNKLKKLYKDKLISIEKHPTENLWIYNYTNTAQFNKNWSSLLKMCRGLILDDDGNIKARPFDKFFNYEEHLGEDSKLDKIPNCSFTAYDKLDGSLGISYQLKDGSWALSTRGSFVSEQAIIGTKLLQDFIRVHYLDNINTYLFEIIYPENRIVVDYGNKRKINLIAIRNIETGSIKPMGTIIKDYKKPRSNSEGVVLYFENGFMCKIKYDEYVRLHKLVTGVNKKTIWELLKNNQEFDELLDRVPDEFYDWVKETKKELVNNFDKIKDLSNIKYNSILSLESRKDQAIKIENFKYKSVVFAMLDNKDYESIIWKLIKPTRNILFKKDIDNY